VLESVKLIICLAEANKYKFRIYRTLTLLPRYQGRKCLSVAGTFIADLIKVYSEICGYNREIPNNVRNGGMCLRLVVTRERFYPPQ
jgi:hypothetical protein